MSSRSRSRASVGFWPVGWNGARKMPNRSGQSSPWASVTMSGPDAEGHESVEQVGLLAHDAGIERLEAQPSARVHAHLTGGSLRVLAVDEHRGARGLGHELRLARAIHGDEPPGGLVDAVADGEQAVVAQDDLL